MRDYQSGINNQGAEHSLNQDSTHWHWAGKILFLVRVNFYGPSTPRRFLPCGGFSWAVQHIKLFTLGVTNSCGDPLSRLAVWVDFFCSVSFIFFLTEAVVLQGTATRPELDVDSTQPLLTVHINLTRKAVQRKPKSGVLPGKYSSFELEWLVQNKCLTV